MRPSVRILGLVAGAALLVARALAGGSPPPDPSTGADPTGSPPIDLSDPMRIEAGKRRFDSTCAAFCHGHAPPLFIGRQDLLPEYAFKIISDGGGGVTPMPPWGNIFTEEEIWELVAYVKFLGTQKPE